MKECSIMFTDLKYIDDDVFEQIKNYTIDSNDLYLTIAGTIGSVGIIPKEVSGMNLTENAAKLTNISCVKEYLLYALLSSTAQEHFTSKFHQVAQPKLSIETASTTPIALPPINEQIRIVSEIERTLKLIDGINNNRNELQTAIKQAKRKILDLAIHGKLVPQDPNDEPATELLKRINPKAEITCDNPQYGKLPKGWCETHIGDAFKVTMGQSPDGSSLNPIDGMEFHQGKILFGNKYLRKSSVLTNSPTKIADADTLLLCVRAPVGVVNITKQRICIGRGLCCLTPTKAINLDYAFYMLTTFQEKFESQSTGSTFKAISGSIIKNEQLWLPPLSEQHRIVAKIEELFAQLDKIEASL